MNEASGGVLDGQVIISRVVEPDDVIVVVESGNLPVLDAVGMLTMAIDTLLHSSRDDDHEH